MNTKFAALLMKRAVIVWEAVAGLSLAYLPVTAAHALFMDFCDQEPVSLLKVQDPQLLMLR